MKTAVLLYNLLQLSVLILASPVLFVKTILSSKYRGRIRRRLGIDHGELTALPGGRPRIWVHALSVGEVSSVQSLIKEMRQALPEAVLLFSAATRSGEQFAAATLRREIDVFLPFPLDVRWSVERVLARVEPDLFILVETDFWPNFLWSLQQRRIPALLVNGRISADSFHWYRRFGFLFRPLFQSFAFLSMQTAADAANMARLGVAPDKVKPLGNLKYDSALPGRSGTAEVTDIRIPAGAAVWVAGSTHAGEEEIILNAFQRLQADFPDLLLILAPRQPNRGGEIGALAARKGLGVVRRSTGCLWPDGSGSVLVLDTLGELAGMYCLADMVFVGGSLVPEGGHNPLEPAAWGKPVLFGPHMEDFPEIGCALVTAGAAARVQNQEDLYGRLRQWLAQPVLRQQAGDRARSWVQQQQGAAHRHLQVVREMLQTRRERHG